MHHLLGLALLLVAGSCHGYFDAGNLQMILPFQSIMAFAPRNNSLVVFGGENATDSYSNDFYELTQTSNGYTWSALPQNTPPPPTSYTQAVYIERTDSMLLMGGTFSSNITFGPLQMYMHNFGTHDWQPWAGNNATNATIVPGNRKEFSASIDQQGYVYVYGGSLNDTAVYNDLWALSLSTMTFTALPSSDVARYGHTTSLLSNGQLVVIGGVIETSAGSRFLAPMEQVYIFDTKGLSWSTQNVTGGPTSPRSGHNAVVGSNDKIVIFGGNDGGDARTRRFLNAFAILDTASWTWTVPMAQGIPPSRRSYAAAAILDGVHMTVAFGGSRNILYNDINVLSIDDGAWLQTFEKKQEESSGLSAGVIAGITIAAVVLVIIILFLLWRFQSYLRWLVTRLHGDIWTPRTGEPVWAETTRICCKIFLMFVFVACLVFIIRQAVTSPSVVQRIEETVPEVPVPDVRFCFEGYPTYADPADPRNPGVVCQTETAYSCSQFVTPLNLSIFAPAFATNLGHVTCFLFRAPDYFTMTATSGVNNGSRLLFYPFADQTVYGSVHVSVYPKAMDPNAKVYGISDDTPVLLSDEDVSNWMNGERNDIQVKNVYSLTPTTYSSLSYEIIDHQYLQDSSWNYFGFAPITNSTPEIETSFRQEAPNPQYMATHSDLGQLAIYPSKFVYARDREVKMYTLLNALGFVGGIFGLIVALQTWLFGYRPRSPWGVVQRWSVGDMRRSLYKGLSTTFRTTDKAGIPFIGPVHRRFSTIHLPDQALLGETEAQRISHVEERMQILELLFKAYYVDDEVFRSLDNANRPENGIVPTSGSGPVFVSGEKAASTGRRKHSQDNVSDILYHRQNSASSDEAPSSRQPLRD